MWGATARILKQFLELVDQPEGTRVTYETLLVEVEDGVATVTLNRPEVRNALSPTLVSELEAALAALEEDAAARVIVLRGAGDKAFCSGADLKGVGDRGGALQARESFSGLPRILEAMARMRTPLVAQVHGFALAGGAGSRQAVTLWWRPTTPSSGCPRSASACCPSSVMAPILRSVGRKRGMLMVLSRRAGLAREALDMGLVSKVVPRASLDAEVKALAAKLAGCRRPRSASPRRPPPPPSNGTMGVPSGISAKLPPSSFSPTRRP